MGAAQGGGRPQPGCAHRPRVAGRGASARGPTRWNGGAPAEGAVDLHFLGLRGARDGCGPARRRARLPHPVALEDPHRDALHPRAAGPRGGDPPHEQDGVTVVRPLRDHRELADLRRSLTGRDGCPGRPGRDRAELPRVPGGSAGAARDGALDAGPCEPRGGRRAAEHRGGGVRVCEGNGKGRRGARGADGGRRSERRKGRGASGRSWSRRRRHQHESSRRRRARWRTARVGRIRAEAAGRCGSGQGGRQNAPPGPQQGGVVANPAAHPPPADAREGNGPAPGLGRRSDGSRSEEDRHQWSGRRW